MEKPANTETLHQEEIMDCLSGLDKSTQTYLARANAVLRGRASSIASGEFYEDQLSVYERLVKVEEVCVMTLYLSFCITWTFLLHIML